MTIRSIGIIGAGTMGAGIAHNAAQHGFAVALTDRDTATVARAIAGIRGFLARAVEKGRMSAATMAETLERIQPADLEEVADCDLVIEAVFEDMTVKRAIYRALAPLLTGTTIVATNTSSFRVDELAAEVPDPARFVGLHYFNPAAVNRLVEVVRGGRTADAVVESVVGFVLACSKDPLLCRDSYGFAVNRFFCPYCNEAARLLDEGFVAAEIDRAARAAFATPLGPFAVMNLTKPRIVMNAQRTLEAFGGFYAVAPQLAATGSAEGLWEIGDAPAADAARDTVIAARLRVGAFLPVLQALDEGVADATGFDMGARVGVRWDAPPCATMDGLGRAAVADILGNGAAAAGTPTPKSLERVGRLLG